MPDGLEAAKDAILKQFAVDHRVEGYDSDSVCSAIEFDEGGGHFSVRVSQEFNDDYGSGQFRANLSQLGEVLRSSKDGKAAFRRDGVFAG